MADPNDFRNLFANMLSAIKDSNKQMQALQNKVQESNKSLQNNVEESNKTFRNKVEASNSKLQESFRVDITSVTEKLIKKNLFGKPKA
jgi:hypothetical protein